MHYWHSLLLYFFLSFNLDISMKLFSVNLKGIRNNCLIVLQLHSGSVWMDIKYNTRFTIMHFMYQNLKFVILTHPSKLNFP